MRRGRWRQHLPLFRQLEPDAITLLRLLSFFNPESIRISILKEGAEFMQKHHPTEIDSDPLLKIAVALLRSSVRLSKAIQKIQRISLVVQKLEGLDRMIWIHDLVQLLLRVKLMAGTERVQWLEIAICLTCKAFKAIGDVQSLQNWDRCSQYVSHIQAMEDFAEQYRLQSVELTHVCEMVAEYFYVNGLYRESENMLDRVLDKRKIMLGEEHPDTLISMVNLALTYRNRERLNDAEKLGIQVLATSKRVLGAEHLDTLFSMNNLAFIYADRGRLDDAEELAVQVLETSKRTQGAEHPKTLVCMANLALINANQGRLTDAEKLGVQVLEIRKRTLGTEHPGTLISMNNLASMYKELDRIDEAIELMKSVVELRTKVIGPDHPSTANSTAYLSSWMAEK